MANTLPTRLTAAQCWYVARVQVKPVWAEEAQAAYDQAELSDTDRAGWEATAAALFELTHWPHCAEKRFSMTFSMENDAFQRGLNTYEVMQILGKVRGHYATGRTSGPLFDSNGNQVGEFLTTWRDDKPAEAAR